MTYKVSELLEQFDSVRTCFSCKTDNRDKFHGALPEKPSSFLWLTQKHTANVITIGGDDIETNEQITKLKSTHADGLVTTLHNTGIEIVTADCLPLLLYECKAEIIGAVHCGWRGTAKGIIRNGIEKMKQQGAKPKNIFAATGPFICGGCYEVGSDVKEAFEPLGLTDDVFKPKGAKFLLNLGRAVFELLVKEGVSPAHIEISNECTFHDKDLKYYSYRRDGAKAGRQLNIIWLK